MVLRRIDISLAWPHAIVMQSRREARLGPPHAARRKLMRMAGGVGTPGSLRIARRRRVLVFACGHGVQWEGGGVDGGSIVK